MLVAAHTGDTICLESLIEQGADVNWQARTLDGATALHEAVRAGSLSAARLLLENGANLNAPNFKGLTPLHVAAYCGQDNMVEALLEAGAEINSRAKDNVTPLHAAALSGHYDTVMTLIRRGAIPDARTSREGLTPLDFAAREGYSSVVELLQDAMGDAEFSGKDT